MTNGNGTSILTTDTGGKLTLLAFAMFLLAGAYNMFTASGWQLTNQFYGGIALVGIAAGMMLVREYLKKKYPGTEPGIDTAEVDAVVQQLHTYRDFVREHADVEIAMANMAIAMAIAGKVPQAEIDKMTALRDEWQKLLATL